MGDVVLKVDASSLRRLAAGMEQFATKQLPYAGAQALNDTARACRDMVNSEMPRIFDRPTPFTERAAIAPRELAATRDRLQATLTLRPIQAKYLLLEETGGTRDPSMTTRKSATALTEPGPAMALNAFGNIPNGTIRKLRMAYLMLQRQRRARLKRWVGDPKRNVEGEVAGPPPPTEGVVYIKGGDPQAHGRVGGFFQLEGGKLARLTGFVSEAHYKPRFRYHERVLATAEAVFSKAMAARFAAALRSARR